jgi:hypothetical protein
MIEMQRIRLTWILVAGATLGVLFALSIGGAVRGCHANRQVGDLDQRVGRLELALGMSDSGAAPSAEPAAPTVDGGEGQTSDTPTPECAVAKIVAYHAWQDAMTKAKALAAPGQAACADIWSDKKKQVCYYAASQAVRTTQAARDAVINGGPAAREAVKNVKDDPKNEGIARARAASDKAFSACGDDLD